MSPLNPPLKKGGKGGFDAVISNPPYIRIQAMKEWAPLEVEFYKKHYVSASKGNYDIYVVFVENSLSLLNKHGRLGFILPHKFFNAKYGEPLREYISKGNHLSVVVHFTDQQVFTDSTTYTCLLFLDKTGKNECVFYKVDDLAAWRVKGKATEGNIMEASITASEWNFAIGKSAKVFQKLGEISVRLHNVAHLFVGLQTDADDVFILEKIKHRGKNILCKSKHTGQEHWFENVHLKPFLKGSLDIRRYSLANISKRLIFPYEIEDGKSILIVPDLYKKLYPLTWNYLEQNHERLASRNKGRMGKEWYGYVYKKNHTRFILPKLLVPSIATGSCFAADLEGEYYFVGSGGGGGGGYGITLREGIDFSYLYLLGILNSSLMSAYIKTTSTPFRGGYIALNRQYIEQVPVRTIDFHDPIDKARHDQMVKLVKLMLDLSKQLPEAKTPQTRTVLLRQIETTDKQIDKLVYKLYDLTDEEIKIVESGTQ